MRMRDADAYAYAYAEHDETSSGVWYVVTRDGWMGGWVERCAIGM